MDTYVPYRDPHWGESLLHLAAEEGDIGMVKNLVNAGESPCRYNDSDHLPIHYAAMENHPVIIEFLLLLRPDHINTRAVEHFTPLHSAADSDSIDAMIMLIESGADCTLTTQQSLNFLDIYITNNPIWLHEYNWSINDKPTFLKALKEIAGYMNLVDMKTVKDTINELPHDLGAHSNESLLWWILIDVSELGFDNWYVCKWEVYYGFSTDVIITNGEVFKRFDRKAVYKNSSDDPEFGETEEIKS